MSIRFLFTALIGLIFLNQNGGASDFSPVERVPGELVVKLKNSEFDQRVKQKIIFVLERQLGRNSVASLTPFKTDSTLFKVNLSRVGASERAQKILSADPLVKHVEFNWVYRTQQIESVPSDPEFGKLWGLHNTGQTDAAGQVGIAGADLALMPIWEMGYRGSKDLTVAVIDTGVQWNHPDLEANIYTNPGESGELSNNGKDDDGNGFIDDIHGWNFAAKTNNSSDDHDHGTHVAGTIGAIGNNGIGVAGVNWNISILPIKFLTAGGSGSLDDAVESINYARIMKVKIMSNSWGGGGYSDILKEAIAEANKAGILFMAAAGNDKGDNDSVPSYPASYVLENVMSVAATDNRDKLASFSNYGAKTVHVAAPGVKILSTIKDGKYGTFSGTSMATPHASGVAALLWSVYPELTLAQVKARLMSTSTPVAELRRKVISRGRMNAYQAVMNIIPPSDDPDESLWKTEARVVESAHPYDNNQDIVFKLSLPGAKYIRVFFELVDMEQRYDKVTVEDPSGAILDEFSGYFANVTSEYVKGDAIQVRLKSDVTVNKYGFKITKIQYIPN